MNPRKRQNVRYWNKFCDHLESRGSQLKFPTYRKDHYIKFRIGERCGVMVRQVIKPRPGQISVVFYMRDPNATTLFDALKEQQAQINNEFGEPPLQWWGAVRRGEQRLGLIKEDADPAYETDWPDQHKWLADQLEKLIKVFRPRIEGAEYKVSSQQTDIDNVLGKINEIAKEFATGDYIYRGEPKYYSKVCSGLYREYETGINKKHFDVGVLQKEILEEAMEYTDKTDQFEILTEIQHYGGNTNLIDFTTDYLVALFFACDSEYEEPGRVILLQRPPKIDPKDYTVEKPPRTIRRAEVQKSVFVQTRNGIVEPDAVVHIPADLKIHMLGYLEKYHDISTKTIYNDLLGFIENRRIHKKWQAEFYEGLSYQMREEYDKAIEHYNTAIEVNPRYVKAYNNRAISYLRKGDFDTAIQDCSIAIEVNPDFAKSYNNRGDAYAEKGDVEEAIKNYNIAIEVNPASVVAYNNRGTVYRRIGKVEEAIKDHNKAIDLKPDYAEAYNSRGIAYYRKDSFDRAIQDHSKAIDLKPDFAAAYSNRGNAYHQKGNLEIAIQNYSEAIKLDPEFADAYGNRGEAWLHLKEWQKAKADLTTAKDMGNDIIESFQNDYESIEDFEAKNEVKMPEDIAALLQRK